MSYGLIQTEYKDSFDIFSLRTSYNGFYITYEKILKIYCRDRKKDLIEGLVHEITEATITLLMKHRINLSDSEIIVNFKPKCGYMIRISHILSLYSQPFYSAIKWQKSIVEQFWNNNKV